MRQALCLIFSLSLLAAGDFKTILQARVTTREAMENVAQTEAVSPAPNPKLSPEEVVRIQLQALKDNDYPEKDSRIKTTFNFASPANKIITGPLSRFARLVKNPAYRPMINHRRVQFGRLKIVGVEAQQRVTLTDQEGAKFVYLFSLSRQQQGPFKDCWMTDAVERLSSEEEEQIIARNTVTVDRD